jgi:triacylglycerol lipase
MDGADNIVVQDVCSLDQSEHLSIAFDPTAAHEILNALDPAHAGPVPCVAVLPGIGAPGYSE